MTWRLPLFIWISVFFLLLLGYFGIVPNIDALASAECDLHSFSPVDCPTSSSEEFSNENNGKSGIIEEQIPSVLPFP